MPAVLSAQTRWRSDISWRRRSGSSMSPHPEVRHGGPHTGYLQAVDEVLKADLWARREAEKIIADRGLRVAG